MIKKNQYKQKKLKRLIYLRDIFYNRYRILNFKRPKWFHTKKWYEKKFLFFINLITKRRRYYFRRVRHYFFFQNGYQIPLRWTYLKARYRNSLIAKNKLYYFFLLKEKVHTLKLNFLKHKSIESFFVSLEYRLDVALWRSCFFPSPAVARFYILHKNVFVNSKIINSSNYQLKEGDIVTVKLSLKPKIGQFLYLVNEYINYIPYVPPFFMEINWDLFSFAIINSPKKEHLKYLNYLYNTNLDLQSLKTYLKRL